MNEKRQYISNFSVSKFSTLATLDVHKQFFSIEEMLDMISVGTLTLLETGKREWTTFEKSAYLQTLMLGQNSSDLIIDNSNIKCRLVVDGQEELKSLFAYCKGNLVPHLSRPLVGGINDAPFLALPLGVRRQFLNKKLAAVTFNYGNNATDRYISLSNLMLLKGASDLWSLVEQLFPIKYDELKRGAEKLMSSHLCRYKNVKKFQELLLVASVLGGAPAEVFTGSPEHWMNINLNTFMGYLVSCPNFKRDFDTLATSLDFYYLDFDEANKMFRQKEYQKRYLLYFLIESGKWTFLDGKQFSHFTERFRRGWEKLDRRRKSPSLENYFSNYVYFMNKL